MAELKILHSRRMEDKIDDDLEEFTDGMFMKSWETLKKSKMNIYKLLFGAGDVVGRVFLYICTTVWKTERYPSSLILTTLLLSPKQRKAKLLG